MLLTRLELQRKTVDPKAEPSMNPAMKWSLVALNLAAAVGLVFLGSFAVAAHRTHAFSTYQELKQQEVLIERPGYDVAQRLGNIGNGGSYSRTIAQIGAGVLVVNALLIGFCWKKPRC